MVAKHKLRAAFGRIKDMHNIGRKSVNALTWALQEEGIDL